MPQNRGSGGHSALDQTCWLRCCNIQLQLQNATCIEKCHHHHHYDHHHNPYRNLILKFNSCSDPQNKFTLRTMTYYTWEGLIEQFTRAQMDSFMVPKTSRSKSCLYGQRGIWTTDRSVKHTKRPHLGVSNMCFANFGHFGAFLLVVCIFRPK